MRWFAALLLVVLAGTGLAGCGDENKVGDKSLLNFKEQAQNRLGETTTTTAAPTTTTAAVTATTLPAGSSNAPRGASPTTATTRPKAAAPVTTATTAPKPQVATLEIAINTNAPFFDPEYARVYVGSIVRWVNKDSVVRVVKADKGKFVSPPIPPGGSYEYKALKAGLFDYADDTRPYVHATLEVIPV